MPTSDQTHERLVEAMIERTPGCLGIDTFTADHIPADDHELLRQICTNCDLQLLCRQYVDTDRPSVGFWAGQYFGPKNPSGRAA